MNKCGDNPKFYRCAMRCSGLGKINTIRITKIECIPDKFTRCYGATDNESFGSLDALDIATLCCQPDLPNHLCVIL